MDDKKRCQSCGMPLGVAGFYGTNEDGTDNHEYCKFCFQNGVYTRPELTLQDMMNMSVENMVNDQHIPREKAIKMAQSVIPLLKRWSQKVTT